MLGKAGHSFREIIGAEPTPTETGVVLRFLRYVNVLFTLIVPFKLHDIQANARDEEQSRESRSLLRDL